MQRAGSRQEFYKVSNIRWLTEDTFSLRMTGKKLSFKAGQHIVLGLPGSNQCREYSLYNGVHQSDPEVLVRKIENGLFSSLLSRLSEGDLVEIDGPMGGFTIDESKVSTHSFVFIASGTGIAPFRSIIQTYPNLEYQVIHGIRFGHEAYDKEVFLPDRYLDCTSRDNTGKVKGRLTGYLSKTDFPAKTEFYLCGNSNMIFDSLDILKAKGFSREQIHCEVYF